MHEAETDLTSTSRFQAETKKLPKLHYLEYCLFSVTVHLMLYMRIHVVEKCQSSDSRGKVRCDERKRLTSLRFASRLIFNLTSHFTSTRSTRMTNHRNTTSLPLLVH